MVSPKKGERGRLEIEMTDKYEGGMLLLAVHFALVLFFVFGIAQVLDTSRIEGKAVRR